MMERKEVFLFLNEPRRISGEELEALFLEYKRTGDMEVERKILIGTLWIIAVVLAEFASKVESQDFEDLRNEGFIGLMYAVENHRPGAGPFLPYAMQCIRGYIRSYISKNKLIPLPKRLRKKTGDINRLTEQGLSIHEAASALGMTEKEAVRALGLAVRADPVETVLAYEDNAGTDISAEDEWFKMEMRRFLTAAIKNVLRERDADIVMSAYGLKEKKSVKELAEKHRLTERRIREILKESALKLRETVRSSGYE